MEAEDGRRHKRRRSRSPSPRERSGGSSRRRSRDREDHRHGGSRRSGRRGEDVRSTSRDDERHHRGDWHRRDHERPKAEEREPKRHRRAEEAVHAATDENSKVAAAQTEDDESRWNRAWDELLFSPRDLYPKGSQAYHDFRGTQRVARWAHLVSFYILKN